MPSARRLAASMVRESQPWLGPLGSEYEACCNLPLEIIQWHQPKKVMTAPRVITVPRTEFSGRKIMRPITAKRTRRTARKTRSMETSARLTMLFAQFKENATLLLFRKKIKGLELNHLKSDRRASVASNENLTQPGEQFQTLLSYEE